MVRRASDPPENPEGTGTGPQPGSELSSVPRAIDPDAPQASRDLIAMSPGQFEMLLAAIAAKPAAPGAPAGDDTNATLAQGILKLIQNQTRGQREENAVNPEISAFSYPEGNVARPKPLLTRETWLCGLLQREDQLTPMEIIAFNNIQTSRRANQNQWVADVAPGVAGARGYLRIMVPARSHDDLITLPPSLLQLLTVLATGAENVNVENLFEEITRMKAEMLTMQAQLTAAGVPAATSAAAPTT